MVLGRVAHYAFDAVLSELITTDTSSYLAANGSPVSAFLAGVRRSTGLTPSVKPDQFSETPNVKKWIDNYLWVGETVMDQSVAFFASSSYFERKR
ncbi:Nn.00g037780.m01.CDS01 [Neocucurbitaria sp. VM-36]